MRTYVKVVSIRNGDSAYSHFAGSLNSREARESAWLEACKAFPTTSRRFMEYRPVLAFGTRFAIVFVKA